MVCQIGLVFPEPNHTANDLFYFGKNGTRAFYDRKEFFHFIKYTPPRVNAW